MKPSGFSCRLVSSRAGRKRRHHLHGQRDGRRRIRSRSEIEVTVPGKAGLVAGGISMAPGQRIPVSLQAGMT